MTDAVPGSAERITEAGPIGQKFWTAWTELWSNDRHERRHDALSRLVSLMNAVGDANAAVGTAGEEQARIGSQHPFHGIDALQMPHQVLRIGPLPAVYPRQERRRGDPQDLLQLFTG